MKRSFPSPWLGSTRGYLSDWITQQWVRLTGKQIDLRANEWLAGPVGETGGIGSDYFRQLAQKEDLELLTQLNVAGLIDDFSDLQSENFPANQVDPNVRDFYERTSQYKFDVWADWSTAFRPFGRLLAYIFSRRLQQLNVPLNSLETSRGMSSEIIKLVDPNSGRVKYTAWLRHLVDTGNVLYAGCYSSCKLPGFEAVCVKVVFPLPNGNAVVVMKAELADDDSLLLSSVGERFGDPGFYFVVYDPSGPVFAKYVRAMRETIHVYKAENSASRADHVLKLFGVIFLRLHYRMTRIENVINSTGEQRNANN